MTARMIKATWALAVVGCLIGAGELGAQATDNGRNGDSRGYAPDVEHQVAILQGLNKITARISPIYATLGLPTYFGSLEIVVRACRKTPPTEPPESATFLEIRELPPKADRDTDSDPEVLFTGWMFASSPAVSALEHAVYDVWVVDCEEPTNPALSGQGTPETTTPASE